MARACLSIRNSSWHGCSSRPQGHHADAVVVAGDIYDRAVPATDAVTLLDAALVAFSRARIPVVLTSGNHDSAVRLGFASGLSEAAGIHLRTRVEDIARPVVVGDSHGEVGIYGIPYLLPDAVMAELGAERSHASVLAAACGRIRADAGAAACPAPSWSRTRWSPEARYRPPNATSGWAASPTCRHVLAGCSYLALGHLHGQQRVGTGGATTAGYSGSPLAFSFSERNHRKSVTLAEIDGAGRVETRLLPAPVPRPLREVRGRLDDLLARADGDLADLAGAWVKAVLTDPARPAAPMERLREKWPHTIALDFVPDGGLTGPDAQPGPAGRGRRPGQDLRVCVEFVAGAPPDRAQRAVIREAVEAAQHGEAAA